MLDRINIIYTLAFIRRDDISPIVLVSGVIPLGAAASSFFSTILYCPRTSEEAVKS